MSLIHRILPEIRRSSSHLLDQPLWRVSAGRNLPALFNDDFFREPFGAMLRLPNALAMDLKETDTEYQLAIDCPGLKKNDVDLQFMNPSTLVVRAQFGQEDGAEGKPLKDKEEDKPKEMVHNSERLYGSFSRSMTLPKNVNAKDARASLADGILRITVPKMGGIENGLKIPVE